MGSLKIPLVRKYYDDNIFFKKASVEFEPGLTVLVGCNGYGKSTMLQAIAARCRKEKIPYIEFGSIEDRRNERNKTTLNGDMAYLAMAFVSSEGEEISMSLGKFAGRLGNFVRNHSDEKILVVTIDALDSGYSIDNVVEAKELLFKTVLKDCESKGIELYIFVTANAYELARDEKCFDPIKGEYVTFENYEQYKKFVLCTRKIKDKRYKNN